MSRSARGEAEIEQLIARNELEPVTGAAADGAPLLDQARRTAATAAGLVSSDPYSTYVLAYDAARFACIALLAQQGLRATTSGCHYAVEQSGPATPIPDPAEHIPRRRFRRSVRSSACS
jgi:hypothetical protein